MKMSAVVHYLKNPVHLVRKLSLEVHNLFHPDHPWLSQGAVKFLDAHLKTNMKVYEWGSGRSTLWLAQRVGEVVSIEYHEGWYHEVTKKIREKQLSNVDLKHIPLDHEKSDPTPLKYDPLPRYVEDIMAYNNEAFDLVIVDGHYRLTCVDQCIPYIKPGGYLLIDNSNRVPRDEWLVPKEWPLVHESENVETRTSIWQRPL